MADAQSLDSRLDPVRERVTASIRNEGIPGWSVAVAEHGRTLWAEGLGRADVRTDRPVREETLFALASVSKLYTSIGVAEAVRARLLSYNDPLSKWLPHLELPGATAMRIHHLLAHTSGLPPLPSRYHARDLRRPGEFTGGAMDMDGEALAGPVAGRVGFVDCAGLVSFLNRVGVELMAPPGELHSYSNEGYVLLGAVLELASQSEFSRYMAERVLGPRELVRTAVGPSEAETLGDVAAPHRRLRRQVTSIEPWEAPAWYPAGGLFASAPDVLRLLATLDADSELFDSHARNLATGNGYGYGVVCAECDGVRVVQHDGGQDGASSAFLLAPEHRIAAVALANIDGADAPGVVRTAARALLGLPLDAPEFILEPSGGAEDVDVAELAGVYSSPEGPRLEFEAAGGTLELVVGDRRVPCGILAPDRIAFGQQPATFLRRDGEIWAIAFRDRVLPRFAQR